MDVMKLLYVRFLCKMWFWNSIVSMSWLLFDDDAFMMMIYVWCLMMNMMIMMLMFDDDAFMKMIYVDVRWRLWWWLCWRLMMILMMIIRGVYLLSFILCQSEIFITQYVEVGVLFWWCIMAYLIWLLWRFI